MAGRPNRWLLLRIAAQNLGRRRWRAAFLGVAVMVAVGVGFASFVAGCALHAGISTSFARMGADLLLVPRTALVNLTASLLTVQPTGDTLAASMATTIGQIEGVARVAPQRITTALIDGHIGNLIAFDRHLDFSIQPWLEDRQSGPLTSDGVIAGGRAPGKLGEPITICGKPLGLYGRLGKTGIGPFDESYFLSFDALAAIAAFCRSSPAQVHADGEACSTDLPLDRVSAFLLQLSSGARAEDVKFAISRLPDVKVVEGNTVLTSSRQALNWLLVGIAGFAVLQLSALLIVVSLLFSAIIEERYRELGLLRAIGANPHQILMIIVAEAAIVTGLGGLAGLVFGTGSLLIFARSLGFYFGLLGVPFSWPPPAVLEAGAAGWVALSVVIGLIAALLPAWQVRRRAPYELIQMEAG